MRTRPPTVDELVSDWDSGEDPTMSDGLIPPWENPQAAWEAVLIISRRKLSDDEKALLAAGPIEDLLVHYGAEFIDRIEAEAEKNPDFAYLLGGVWGRRMPVAIWKRVEVARKGIIW